MKNELLNSYPANAFTKYYGMDQEGVNEYVSGCIQTANALMPVISDLLLGEIPSPVYMSIAQSGKTWSVTPQMFLGIIPWSSAVIVAKAQGTQVRLSHSAGYDNQGHYINP